MRKKTDVTTRMVVKDGRLALELTWWVNNVLDHIEYVFDRELF